MRLNGIAGADVSVSGADRMPKGAVLLVANHEGNFVFAWEFIQTLKTRFKGAHSGPPKTN